MLVVSLRGIEHPTASACPNAQRKTGGLQLITECLLLSKLYWQPVLRQPVCRVPQTHWAAQSSLGTLSGQPHLCQPAAGCPLPGRCAGPADGACCAGEG